MSKLTPSSLVPDFAREHASTDGERSELAELFAKLGAFELVADSGVLARGRARLLAAVAESSERFSPLFGKLTQFFDLSADALREQFKRASNEGEWEQGPLPWVSLFHFSGGPAVAGMDTGFVRIKKGMPFPPHRHQGGSEHVLILDGGYHDNAQRWWGPGELHVMTEGSEHSLQMSADQDVLLAVVIGAEIQVLGMP